MVHVNGHSLGFNRFMVFLGELGSNVISYRGALGLPRGFQSSNR